MPQNGLKLLTNLSNIPNDDICNLVIQWFGVKKMSHLLNLDNLLLRGAKWLIVAQPTSAFCKETLLFHIISHLRSWFTSPVAILSNQKDQRLYSQFICACFSNVDLKAMPPSSTVAQVTHSQRFDLVIKRTIRSIVYEPNPQGCTQIFVNDFADDDELSKMDVIFYDPTIFYQMLPLIHNSKKRGFLRHQWKNWTDWGVLIGQEVFHFPCLTGLPPNPFTLHLNCDFSYCPENTSNGITQILDALIHHMVPELCHLTLQFLHSTGGHVCCKIK